MWAMAISPGYWQRVVAAEPDDTISTFEQASEVRYYDGQELLFQPDRLAGAIYLLGYCVELVLKVAYCRMVGVGPSDPVWNRYQALTGTSAGAVRHHRLRDLTALVATERISRGFAVDPVFEGEFQRLALLAASHWKEEMRYRSLPATQAEADEVDEAATWMMAYRDDLSR